MNHFDIEYKLDNAEPDVYRELEKHLSNIGAQKHQNQLGKSKHH